MGLPNPWPADGATGWSAALEGNVEYAAATAEAALASSSGVPGVIQADDMPGASDSIKMGNALTTALGMANTPWVQLPARIWNTGSTSYAWAEGVKIHGAGYANAAKNQELGNNTCIGIWQTSCGTGASSLLGTSTTQQSCTVSNVAFYAPANSSQIFRASGGNGLYPSVFHNLSLYGGPYFFGNPGEKFLTTQMVTSGHWTVLGYNDTPFTLGGGDCDLWVAGYLNSNSSGSGGGKPIVDLQGLGKTNIGFMYLTNEGDWVGLRVSGGSDKGISVFGGAYEGRSQTTLSTRPVIDIQGGSLDFFGPWLAQVASGTATANGVIHQSGGTATFHGGTYHRGAATAATFPLLYQTGGTAYFHGAPKPVTGDAIRVRWSDTTTETLPLPANGHTP